MNNLKSEIKKITENKYFVPAAAGVVTVTAVGFTGYLVKRKRKDKKTNNSTQLTFDFSEQSKADFLQAVAEDVSNDLADAIDEKTNESTRPENFVVVDETDSSLGPQSLVSENPYKVLVSDIEDGNEILRDSVVNVFGEKTKGHWDEKEEALSRQGKNIFLISEDEYFGDDEFHKLHLTYYAGDDILVDGNITPIHKYTDVVGELVFGKGSNSEDTAFVRNTRLETDYEITLDSGHYAIEVLGYSYEEDSPPIVPKFREERVE